MTNIQLDCDNQPQRVDCLPPVGTECLMFVGDFLVGDQVLIMGYFNDLVWVTVQRWDSEGDYSGHHKTFVINDNDGVKFQPIKSAREQWANRAILIYNERDEITCENLAQLYDAMQSGEIPMPKEVNR